MNKKNFNIITKLIIYGGYRLKKIGIKDTGLLYFGLQKNKIKRIIDGIFFGSLIFIDDDMFKLAQAFKYHLDNIDNFKNKLTKNIDKESTIIVYKIIDNLNYILQNENKCVLKKKLGVSNNSLKISKYMKKYLKDIKLPLPYFEESVFYYKHGIDTIPNIKQYTKKKDILDCGAFIGDSAIMFNKELDVDKIYCLEPEEENYNLLLDTIKENGQKENIIPLKIGVGDKKETLNFNNTGAGSFISELGSYRIHVDTIDNIVKENDIRPGLIKWDIEGFEYNSILGAEKTIKNFKPILLISIYHNGKDFFEIKPLIESWDLGYKFKIMHLRPNHPFAETMLIAFI